MPKRRAPARWPMVVLVTVLVGGGIAGLVTRALEDGDGDHDAAAAIPSERVAGAPSGLSRTVGAYRLTYRVEGFAAAGTVVVDTERRWVRLPFESRVEVFAGEPGAPEQRTFLQIAALGMLQTGRPGEEETVLLAAEPALAPGDARVTALDEGPERGLLDWRHERREVAGRRCEVFRASGPVDVDRAAPLARDPESFADLCVDAAGIVLQEEWYVDRRLFRRRTAVDVVEGAFTARDLFTPTAQPVSPRLGGGGLAEVRAGSRPEGVDFFELPDAPSGFRHRGRYAYTPPRARQASTPVAVPAIAGIIDVWVRGPDVVTVENGGTLNNADPFGGPVGDAAVEVGPLGTGELLPGLRSGEVRVLLDGGRFVRVRGTLPASALVAFARSLAPAEGAAPGIEPLEPSPTTTVPPREEGAPPAVVCTRDDQGRLSCREGE